MIARLLRYFNLIDFLIVVGLTVIFGMIFHHFYLPLPIKYQEITITKPILGINHRIKGPEYIELIGIKFNGLSTSQHHYIETCHYLDNGSYNLCNHIRFLELTAINEVHALAISNDLSGEDSNIIIKTVSFKDASNTNHLFRVSQNYITDAMNNNRYTQWILRFIIPVIYLWLLHYFFKDKIRALLRKRKNRIFR